MHDDSGPTHAANTTFAADEEGTAGINTLRFLQDYEVARADALEQMYAMASGIISSQKSSKYLLDYLICEIRVH